jgi:predicted NAD/FAD-dependent oxidoreductase
MALRPSVTILGAGIAGLVAAKRLKDAGMDVLVLEKSRGVGGRMATRRIGSGVADHGAQFFTVRESRFERQVSEWLRLGLAAEWTRGFPTPEGAREGDGHRRYRSVNGMTAIPKHLARGLAIRLNQRVTQIGIHEKRLELLTVEGAVFLTDGVILTPPVPQSLQVLKAGGQELLDRHQRELDGIRYDPCIALMALLDGPSRVPEPGGVQFQKGGPIAWLADNHLKGISPEAVTLTIHASAPFSRAFWDRKDGEIEGELLSAAARWLSRPPLKTQIHRWRFSKPIDVYPHECLFVGDPAPIAFAGDAFAGPRVEGAFLSGMAAADRLATALS